MHNIKILAGHPLPSYCDDYVLMRGPRLAVTHLAPSGQYTSPLCGVQGAIIFDGGDEFSRVLCVKCARIAQGG